ncbi:MAG: phytanoyl-CoA dioxygenase family protein [Alphaproteobacteria bacterium]|jgi:ectoine hydroxylase-related dioxygenase (phytanoyl-CoA dioxygenase family)
MLNQDQVRAYRDKGHLTVAPVFADRDIQTAVADAEAWAGEEISRLDAADRAWYVEGAIKERAVLRKLDNPVYLRPAFRALAGNETLLAMVAQLIGPDPQVFFSQIFFKAAGGGGPKPVHQDNFYFGPQDRDSMITAWIALDDADVENGCLFFGEGTNLGPVIPHTAPAGEPFNLLIPGDVAREFEMTPAPVLRGGVSFHHGNTLHQSSDNQSSRPRRACAIHYGNGGTSLVTPALTYDQAVVVKF